MVNEATVNTVTGARVVNEDTALAVGGISVTDVDGNLSTVQLAVAICMSSGSRHTSLVSDWSSDVCSSDLLSGSQADINATLASLAYQGTLNYNGPDTLTVTSRDSNAVTDVDTVAITVLAVDDAPVAQVRAAEADNDDTAPAACGISVTDVDGNLS